MDPFSTAARLVVTCQRGLAPWLEQELKALGHADASAFHGGVSLGGTLADCIQLNLQLRCASQVLYSLGQFRCKSPDDLYRGVTAMRWEAWLPADGYLTVHGNVDHPSIKSGMFANVKIKDAIVDRMRRQTGVRPDSGSERRGAVVSVFWRGDRAEVFLDTSGDTLAKHGYRKLPGSAPMVEALAAATIMATNWDRQSPFINPMCGAGTLAIEAALLATVRCPGLFREAWAFQHLRGYDESVLVAGKARLKQAISSVKPCEFLASDHDPAAIEATRKNAAAAGVGELVRIEQCDFSETTVPPAPPRGVVMFNPEYGERLGEEASLVEIYGNIGTFLKHRCGGHAGFVFTGNLELAKRIGLRPKRKFEFHTARIECRLLEFELYAGSRKASKQFVQPSSLDPDASQPG